MLIHIVMWKIKPDARGLSKEVNAQEIKHALESLPARIPEIQSLSVGIQNFEDSSAWDLVLHSVFEDYTALQAYQNHPDHLEVASLISQIRSERAVVDYLV